MSGFEIGVSEQVPPGEIWVQRCAATLPNLLRVEPPYMVDLRCERVAGHAGMHGAHVPNPLGPEWTNW